MERSTELDLRIELDTALLLPQMPNRVVLALNDALDGLTPLDEQQGRIVEMRFFGGLGTEEIARALGHIFLDRETQRE